MHTCIYIYIYIHTRAADAPTDARRLAPRKSYAIRHKCLWCGVDYTSSYAVIGSDGVRRMLWRTVLYYSATCYVHRQ